MILNVSPLTFDPINRRSAQCPAEGRGSGVHPAGSPARKETSRGRLRSKESKVQRAILDQRT